MKKLLMTAAVLLTSSMGSSLLNSNTIISNKGSQTRNAIYDFHETYYTSDHDSSETHTLISWKQFGYNNWNDLTNNFGLFTIKGTVDVSLSPDGAKYYANLSSASNRITSNPDNTLRIVAQKFRTATFYTALIISVWHDDNNILFRWNGYFKGDTHNGIDINLKNARFGHDLKSKNPHTNQISYNWSKPYYKPSEDNSQVYSLYNISSLGGWNNVQQKFSFLEINGLLVAGIENHDTIVESAFKSYIISISDNETETTMWVAPYFETAGRYTIIIVHIWHDNDNIYFQWYAYFKGDVNNTIAIHIDSVTLYEY